MANGGNIAGQIDGFLKSYGSPMAGLGSIYAAAGKKYGVDPRLPAAISIAESSGGKSLYGSFNAWGWGPGNSFTSWADGINTVTRGLRRGYLDQGLTTPATIVSKWAPASDGNNEGHWSQTVSDYMRKMGASPAISMALAASTAPPASTSGGFNSTSNGSDAMIAQLQASLDSLSGRRSLAGIQSAAQANLSSIARHGRIDPFAAMNSFASGLQSDSAANEATAQQSDALSAALKGLRSMSSTEKPSAEKDASVDVNTPSTVPAAPVAAGDVGKWAKLGSGADRAGVTTHASVLSAVARIAQLFGSPLTITTGTNHNQMVRENGVSTGRQSQHWTGDAADILYGHGTGPGDVDPALTRLGRTALIAAGMDPKEAAKQYGGAFNVGGWNILFNTGIGGNHYNHLHVGV